MSFWETLCSWIIPTPRTAWHKSLVTPGLYHYRRERDGQFVRYHLRVDPSGTALLLAAASEAVRLSPAGAAAAKRLLEGESPEAVQQDLPVENAHQVVADVAYALADLGQAGVRYPIFNLVDPASNMRPTALIAPFQADVVPSSSERTNQIIDRLWDAGIPHVRFVWTAESCNEEDLVRMVVHAEDVGMIAGVRTLASRLANNSSLIKLAEAGLDYVVVPWGVSQPLHDELFGKGDFDCVQKTLAEVLKREMTPVVDIPLFTATANRLDDAIGTLEDWNVRHVEVFAIGKTSQEDTKANASTAQAYNPQEMRQVASLIEDLADRSKMQLIWLPPVRLDPDQALMTVASHAPRAGGDVTIRVESDGTVIPPRGPHQSAGNLLHQSWEQIWKNRAFDRFATRLQTNTRCDQCPGLAICAADCPANTDSWVSSQWSVIGDR